MDELSSSPTIVHRNRRNDFFRTEQGFFNGCQHYPSTLYGFESDTDQLSMHTKQTELSLNPIEKCFESFGHDEQAKVLRMTQDSGRLDRFINLFDPNKSNLRKKIRVKGQTSLLSKSMVYEKRKGPSKLGRDLGIMTIKEEEIDHDNDLDEVNAPKLTLKHI